MDFSQCGRQEKNGFKTIVGMNILPQPASLEEQNRFTLSGKEAIQYIVLGFGVGSVLLSLYSLIVCIRTKLPRRKWPWILFIIFGFGQLVVNWTTGEWGIVPIAVQLFSFSASAPLYGPWTISTSMPLGAILFLLYRARLTR